MVFDHVYSRFIFWCLFCICLQGSGLKWTVLDHSGRSEGYKGGWSLNSNVNGRIYSKRFTLDSCRHLGRRLTLICEFLGPSPSAISRKNPKTCDVTVRIKKIESYHMIHMCRQSASLTLLWRWCKKAYANIIWDMPLWSRFNYLRQKSTETQIDLLKVILYLILWIGFFVDLQKEELHQKQDIEAGF